MRRRSESARQVCSLDRHGMPEVPVLGMYRNIRAREMLLPHLHENIVEICLLAEGIQRYESEGRLYLLNPGDVFISYPGRLHSTGREPEERGVLYWVQFEIDTTPRVPFLLLNGDQSVQLQEALRGLRRHHFAGSAQLLRDFADAIRIATAPTPLASILLGAKLVELVCEIISCDKQAPKNQPVSSVNGALRYIEEHLEDPCTLQEIAAKSGLSLSWFKSKFRSAVGMSPWEYVLRARVERAKKILAAGDDSVTRIALQLGFSSSQHFATVFRRYCDRTPGEFRRQVRKH